MAKTIFDWQGIEDAASDLPTGLHSLSAMQAAFLLATIENKSIFRGNWQVDGVPLSDIQWDETLAFIADTEQSIMAQAALPAGFRVFKTSSQSLTSDTYTKIVWHDTDFDVNGDFDFANDRFVASVEGYYLFSAITRMSSSGEHGSSLTLNLVRNGTQIGRAATEAMPFAMSSFIWTSVEMSVGDYIELFGQQNSTVDRTMWSGIHTKFLGIFVGIG